MNNRSLLWLVTITAIVLEGCTSYPIIVRCPDGGYAVVEECAPVVKYVGSSFQVGSFATPQLAGLSISGVRVNDTLLQKAADMAQICDIQRMSYCSIANKLSLTCSSDRASYLISIYTLKNKLDGLTVILTTPHSSASELEKLVANWMGSTAVNLIDQSSIKTPTSSSNQSQRIQEALDLAIRTLNLDPSDEKTINKLENSIWHQR